MPSDATTLILVAATLIVAVHHFYQQNTQLTNQLNSCQTEYKGFREGVVYGK